MEGPTLEIDPVKERIKKIAKSLYELTERNHSLLGAAIGQRVATFQKKNPSDEVLGDAPEDEEHTVWIFDGKDQNNQHRKDNMMKLEEGGLIPPVVAFDNIGLGANPAQTVTTPYDGLDWEGKDSLHRYLPARVLGPNGILYRFTNRIYLDLEGNGLVEEGVILAIDNFFDQVDGISKQTKKVDFQPREPDTRFRDLRTGDLEKVSSFLADTEAEEFVIKKYKFK